MRRRTYALLVLDAVAWGREAVPRLLSEHLRRADPAATLVHVGPAALQLAPDARYVWIPPLSPDNFDRLLGSVDLLLSANISATTNGRAIAAGVSVLVPLPRGEPAGNRARRNLPHPAAGLRHPRHGHRSPGGGVDAARFRPWCTY
jgi:hypothetical protein